MIKKPPTEEQLKEAIKDLLKDANLEEVTMKQITRQVCYFKAFIRVYSGSFNTVKCECHCINKISNQRCLQTNETFNFQCIFPFLISSYRCPSIIDELVFHCRFITSILTLI